MVHYLKWVVQELLVGYPGLHRGQDFVDECGVTYSVNVSRASYYLEHRGDAVLAGQVTMALDSQSCRPVRTHLADLHCAQKIYSRALFWAKC